MITVYVQNQIKKMIVILLYLNDFDELFHGILLYLDAPVNVEMKEAAHWVDTNTAAQVHLSSFCILR